MIHYVLVEDGRVIDIINYEPNTPDTVSVYPIPKEDYDSIVAESHFFDLETRKVIPVGAEITKRKLAIAARDKGKTYLQETDWIVMRHIREIALKLPTTLSDEEYIALETERHTVAKALTG